MATLTPSACVILRRPSLRKNTRHPTPPRVATAALSANKHRGEQQETDVVVIGAGIGGLSCAAMAAKYGLDVSLECFLPQQTLGAYWLLELIDNRLHAACMQA